MTQGYQPKSSECCEGQNLPNGGSNVVGPLPIIKDTIDQGESVPVVGRIEFGPGLLSGLPIHNMTPRQTVAMHLLAAAITYNGLELCESESVIRRVYQLAINFLNEEKRRNKLGE